MHITPATENLKGKIHGDLFVLLFFCNTAIGVDNIPPVIENCPTGPLQGDVTLDRPFAEVSWPPLIVTDNSGLPVEQDSGPVNNFGFYPEGENTVRIVFSDAAGNQAVCEFVINVVLGKK